MLSPGAHVPSVGACSCSPTLILGDSIGLRLTEVTHDGKPMDLGKLAHVRTSIRGTTTAIRVTMKDPKTGETQNEEHFNR